MSSKYDDALGNLADSDFESELSAIRAILKALTPLNQEARARVVSYSFKRLGIIATESTASAGPIEPARSSGFYHPQTLRARDPIIDIRSLKEEKQPSSAREMAVLVAYYLSDVAPPAERKNEISVDDIRQYFKQGGFRLPVAPEMTLIDTKNAGYLDSGSQRGMYKLNPVGYNLVVHSLPSSGENSGKGRPSRKAKKKISR